MSELNFDVSKRGIGVLLLGFLYTCGSYSIFGEKMETGKQENRIEC